MLVTFFPSFSSLLLVAESTPRGCLEDKMAPGPLPVLDLLGDSLNADRFLQPKV